MTKNKTGYNVAIRPTPAPAAGCLTMPEFIAEYTADLQELEQFYRLSISTKRLDTCQTYLTDKIASLDRIQFAALTRTDQVDWLLSSKHLQRRLDAIELQRARVTELDAYLGTWTAPLIELCESRQQVTRQDGRDAAERMSVAVTAISQFMSALSPGNGGRQVANRASSVVEELHKALEETVNFYRGYDPSITWWIAQPWSELSPAMLQLRETLHSKAMGDDTESGDIVGDALGRVALLKEIQAECLPYSPEELIAIGEQEFRWCEAELRKATTALGLDDPKVALERVKNTFVEPGEQIHLVHALAEEAVSFIQERDMITVPSIARQCWQTHMMSPAHQKINPFFLGGSEIIVSYPTDTMSHPDKLMSMRGNNPAFSRSTVFHELIPGHHLQFHYMARYRTYRQVFETPFWIEGWALYWEMILWDRGFPGKTSQNYATNEAENKIGMLFWRMHRCARIIFSIKFHLGQMTPQECVDMLVDRVGHERATAEGEVRRSFNGDYSPLYQAGYMLGALQLVQLRKELLNAKSSDWTEKQFHDAVLKENNMPIELLRALLKKEPLSTTYSSSWRFYDFD